MTMLAGATQEDSNRNLLHFTYALFAASLLLGPIAEIVAVVIAYVKRDDVADTWLQSHVRWQIRTFWFSLLWGIVGVVTALVFVGFAVLIAVGIWWIYRIVKGWLYLLDGKAMYAPKGEGSAPKR